MSSWITPELISTLVAVLALIATALLPQFGSEFAIIADALVKILLAVLGFSAARSIASQYIAYKIFTIERKDK